MQPRLSWEYLMRIVPILRLNPVLCHDLDKHALEVDRHSALQLVGAHPQNLEPLLQVDRRVVVLVQYRETVVPKSERPCQSSTIPAQRRPCVGVTYCA